MPCFENARFFEENSFDFARVLNDYNVVTSSKDVIDGFVDIYDTDGVNDRERNFASLLNVSSVSSKNYMF